MRSLPVASGVAILLLTATSAYSAGGSGSSIPRLAGPLLPQQNPVARVAPPPPQEARPVIGDLPLSGMADLDGATEIAVGDARVVGNEALDTATLSAAFAGLSGTTATVATINEARLAIERAYETAGYPYVLVHAGVVPLDDRRKTLVFTVIEGRIAEVKLAGDLDPGSPSAILAMRFLQPLIGPHAVTAAALERALLLVADIPGMAVAGAEPEPTGAGPGILRLVVTASHKTFSGLVSVDNRGSANVGPWQGVFVGGINGLTRYGDRTEVSIVGAPNSALWFAQGALEGYVGDSGLRLRVYGGTGEVRPTGFSRRLGVYTATTRGGASATYPIVLRNQFGLTAVANFDLFDGERDQGVGQRARASRDQVRTVRLGLDGRLTEHWIAALGDATNVVSIRLHQGIAGLGATSNGYELSGRGGVENFGFSKISGELERTQPLFAPADNQMIRLRGLLVGQWTNDILPLVEQYVLGGNRLGRGFYSGQVSGDKAYGYALELQYDVTTTLPFTMPLGSDRLAPQFYVFRDYGRVEQNLPSDPNGRLSSWGGGVRLRVSDQLQFNLEGAHRETRFVGGPSPLHETALIFGTQLFF